MCARCEVDIGSKMSKTERWESENLFAGGRTCTNSLQNESTNDGYFSYYR